MNLTDFMDESIPGENKRLPSTDPTPAPVEDLHSFMKVIDEIDKKLPSSFFGNVTELTKNKHCLVGLKKDVLRLYNHAFHGSADGKSSKQKKTKPNTRSSLKQACNDSGHATSSS